MIYLSDRVAIQISCLYNNGVKGWQTVQAMMDELESLKGQKVEVIYGGIVYRGVLVGTSEDELQLQTLMEWVSLPLEGIAAVKKAER